MSKGNAVGTKLLLVAALGLLVGCAALPSSAPPPGAPAAVPAFAAELEPYSEAVDPACAYFNFIWGRSAELAGRLAEARFAYEQALVCDRRSVPAMRNLALLLVRDNQREEAIVWLRRLIELQPDNAASLSLLANLYAAGGETGLAIELYQNLLQADPANVNLKLLLGAMYGRHGDHQTARRLLEELTADHPDLALGHYYLARLYRELKLTDPALAAYERALALNWSAGVAQEAAELYEANGRYDESLRLYRRMVAEDPADERARGMLANIYLRLNRVDEALAELSELREHIVEVDKVDLTIARILLDEERYDEAIALLAAMLPEEPRLDAVRSMLVLAYYRKGQIALARELLEEIRPGDYGYEDAVQMLARIYFDQRNFSGAEQVLRRAISDPTHRRLSFYVTLALLYAEGNDAGRGIAVFEQARRELGDDPRVLSEHALFLDKMGDTAGALAKMEEVLRLDPQDPYALNYVGYTWADRGENLEQARLYLEEAASLKPEDGAIRDSLGWVYYRLGDYPRAVVELEQALELAGEDPEIYDHLGDAYRAVDKLARALEMYRRAAELLTGPPAATGTAAGKLEVIRQKIRELEEAGR